MFLFMGGLTEKRTRTRRDSGDWGVTNYALFEQLEALAHRLELAGSFDWGYV